MSAASISARLRKVQEDDDAIRMGELGGTAPVDDLLPEVIAMPRAQLASRLLEWNRDAPDALGLLLKSAAKSDASAVPVARALAGLLITWKEGEGPWAGMEDVLVRAFPQLTAPERDWVAEREAVRERYGLVPGKDYVAMGEPNDTDQWPADRPLPPLDDVRGVQARLLRAGFNAGPITGQWNDATRRALLRYQVERGIAGTGELDDPTRSRLADEE